MKKLYTAIIASIFLSACVTVPPAEQNTVTRVDYVIKIPPKELITLPPTAKDINLDTATQADVASWLIAREERMQRLENMIRAIAEFFKSEQEALNNSKRVEINSGGQQDINKSK